MKFTAPEIERVVLVSEEIMGNTGYISNDVSTDF